MTCVLRAAGSSFDPDAFLRDSSLHADPVYRRGEPKFASRPEGARWKDSGFGVGVSDAGFSNLDGQIRDAVQFLVQHEAELRRLAAFEGVEVVCLDFGVARRDVAVQSDLFPAQILEHAGRLGVDLMVSHYAVSKSHE